MQAGNQTSRPKRRSDGQKWLVLMYGGKPLVVSKQHLKAKIKEGAFCKGFTPEKAESLAIYKTR